MHFHYLPRFYLKGFTESKSSPYIWVYEKGTDNLFKSNIKKVAKEKNFYTEFLESYLAKEIEEPAKPVIDNIREGKRFTKEDKEILANYLIVFLKRVPRIKQLANKWFDEISKDFSKWLNEELVKSYAEDPQDKEKIKYLEERFRVHNEGDITPEEIWENIMPPDETKEAVDIVFKMNWIFFVVKRTPIFITGDSPVWHTENLGVGHEDSELTFPISKNVALWASWRTDLREGYLLIGDRYAKEINRRIISHSLRYVFSPRQEKWLPVLVKKKKHLLRWIELETAKNSSISSTFNIDSN